MLTDDKSYLGVITTGLTADLLGLESILEFHAAANLKLNKASDAAGLPIAKLNWATLATTGLTLPVLTGLSSTLDVHLDGTVALDALDGVLVASGGFSLDLGQVSTTAPSNGVSFTNADALTLTLTGVQVWVGVGGSLSGTSATSTVVNGTLGFGGGVTSLTLVAIKD